MDLSSPEEFGNKIKELRESKRFTLRQASQQSNLEGSAPVSPSYWSLIERGKRNIPKPETLKRMAKGLRVEEEQLMKIAGYVSPAPENAIPYDPNDMVEIPVVGTIKCGTNGLAMFDYQGKESVNGNGIEKESDYFWLVTSGDSMIGDGIRNGDYALIRKQSNFENGDICAIVVDGEEGTLKHITKDESSIVLTASNPNVAPRVFVGEHMNDVFVAGKLVRMMRKY